jgi:hypothetical protein
MEAQLRWWFWLESAVGGVSLGMALLTAMWNDWIEAVFRTAPDHGSGLLEWGVVAGLAVVAALMGLLARAEWRRAGTAVLLAAGYS